MAREELAAAGSGKAHDVLDVRHGGRDRPERRRIQRASNESQSQRAAHSALDLEPARRDVFVRDPIACRVKREAEDNSTQPGANQGPAGRAGSDMHGDDHRQRERTVTT